MKTWKLVSGILSIVLCLFVLLQSCAAGTVNALEASGEVSGSAGLIVSIMMLAGGIVSIVTRKGTKGGNIAIIILYGIAALCGFTMAGNFKDLNIWAFWCLICAVLAAVSLIKSKDAKLEIREHSANSKKKLKLSTLNIILIIIATVFIAGVSYLGYCVYAEKDIPLLNALFDIKTNKDYTAEEIANALKKDSKNIDKIIVYTADTDPNKLMGKTGAYTGKAAFSDKRYKQDKKDPIGGSIEVFDTQDDAEARYDYIKSITQKKQFLQEYMYRNGKYLLRINGDLKASQAEEYQKIFNDIISK